jgi:hypothetical protein
MGVYGHCNSHQIEDIGLIAIAIATVITVL